MQIPMTGQRADYTRTTFTGIIIIEIWNIWDQKGFSLLTNAIQSIARRLCYMTCSGWLLECIISPPSAVNHCKIANSWGGSDYGVTVLAGIRGREYSWAAGSPWSSPDSACRPCSFTKRIWHIQAGEPGPVGQLRRMVENLGRSEGIWGTSWGLVNIVTATI